MTNENQNQPNLEDMLLGLSSENKVLNELGKSKSIKEQANLYEIAAQMVSGKKEGENYERAMREFTRSPVYAHLEIEGHRDNFAENIKDLYKQNKDKITKGIESKINKNLAKAKNKADASMILAGYLNDIVINIPEISQDQVDEIERMSVHNMGLPYAFEARGSVEQYKSLELRKKASEYLKETKDSEGKTTGYSVNSEKLGKVMDNVIAGASLYGRVKDIEDHEARQQAQRN